MAITLFVFWFSIFAGDLHLCLHGNVLSHVKAYFVTDVPIPGKSNQILIC